MEFEFRINLKFKIYLLNNEKPLEDSHQIMLD